VALVFEQIELLRAALRVDDLDVLALFQEHAVHAHVRAHAHHVVVDEVALLDRGRVVVAVDQVLEVARRVRGRSRREANLDRVEVIERAAPGGLLGGGVSAVAFVGDDDVEGVDRDVEAVGVLVDALFGCAGKVRQRLAAEDVHRHALDRADVDERVIGAGVGEVVHRYELRVELVALVEIAGLKARRVDLVLLVELEPGRGVERSERAHRLRRERAAVDEKQHALGDTDFISRWTWFTSVKVLPVPVAIATRRWRLRSAIACSTAAFASRW
jgi:hypothetical protein